MNVQENLRSDSTDASTLTDAPAPAAPAGVDLDAILRIAAFDDAGQGGNPAGVWIGAALPPAAEMGRLAHAVGFSETAFAAPEGPDWRVRYFSPESEVPFCGHATIALGAALARAHGDGRYTLRLNAATITVDGRLEGRLEGRLAGGQEVGHGGERMQAALQSPPTRSAAAPGVLVDAALALFGYTPDDLDPRIPPALAHGGADHMVLALRSRVALAAMRYDLDEGRDFMVRHGLVTVVLAWAEDARLFHTRNPFASGGVYEDPATGAGTAALAGYLRDIGWPHGGCIDVVQGEDMGMRSRLKAEIGAEQGGSIRVSGSARMM